MDIRKIRECEITERKFLKCQNVFSTLIWIHLNTPNVGKCKHCVNMLDNRYNINYIFLWAKYSVAFSDSKEMWKWKLDLTPMSVDSLCSLEDG